MFQFGVAPGKYWLFGLLAFLAWTVGGYADGANALELFGVPVLIGLLDMRGRDDRRSHKNR